MTLTGAAIGGSAADGSGFYVFLLDSGFSPIVGSLSSGEVANVIVNPDGTTTAQGSEFAGGFVDVTQKPEAGAGWMTMAGVAR